MTKKAKKKAKIEEENDDILADPVEKKPQIKAQKKGLVGENVKVKTPDGAEFLGKVISERGTPSGDQVYLQLNGCVSRWFSSKDILK